MLCGGRGSRLGGVDKPLVELAGKTLLARLIERLEPQVDAIVLSGVRDSRDYEPFGYPLVEDEDRDQGPLAGIVSGTQRRSHALDPDDAGRHALSAPEPRVEPRAHLSTNRRGGGHGRRTSAEPRHAARPGSGGIACPLLHRRRTRRTPLGWRHTPWRK